VPRNRTVRLAVLGSSVQRAASPGYPSTRSSALKRRIVVGGLVLLSLVLITISFRSDALDPAQGAAASALRPFEVAAERVSRPFRDAVSWTRGVFHAKSDNEKLRNENEALRRQVIQNESALQENVQLRELLRYRDSPRFPTDYRAVAARVLSNPQSRFDQRVTISAGSDAGLREQDVVVTGEGLVGQVTKVFSSLAVVTLITDEDSGVRAADLTSPAAVGILKRGGGGVGSLVLDRVTKDKNVNRGDVIITAGSPGRGQLPSFYPRDIEIGTVTSVGQNDTDLFKQIQVRPFVDFTALQSVLVLVPKSQTAVAP
jgi:rod shape-determining protein MreC